MTHRAIRQLRNLVFLHKLLPQCKLIAFRFPHGVENLRTRAHEFLRPAMALQAPFHRERAFTPRQRHLADRTVARDATDAFFDVNTVIEIGEIRQVIHTHPLNGLVVAPTRAHRFEHYRSVVNLGMARHARLRGGDAGKAALFHGSVAITAINAELCDVMAMAKGDGLFEHDVRARHIRRALQRAKRPKQEPDKKNTAKDADFGKSIRAGMKDLRHARL